MPLKTKQKIGRNDPCPCGSGKKYKQCCVNNSDAWREQRNAAGLLTQKMNSFATQYFADELMAAWLDFNQQDQPDSLQDNPSEAEIFIPYFLFDWRPEPVSRKRAPLPGAVAQAFLLREAERLPQPERAILDQALTQPLTFYEVVRARPGEGMEVRDLLIGGEFNVTERTGSRFFQTGDITYGQVCDLPESTTFSRLAPLRIPPQSKPAIFALRDSLRKKIAKQNRPLTVADLILHRELVRTTYLDLRDAMNRGPVLSNTDGDPFITHTLTFQTASAQAAFEGLAPLAFGFSKADLLLRAKMGADGALEEIEIPWQTKGNRIHNDWETTLLGTIQISGRSLVVEVNSEKRATRIRKEIDKRLGILATHQETSATPPDLDGKPVQPGPLDPIAAFGAFSNAAFSPELQVELQQRVENWIHQKVPALGGRTPLDAVRDPDGKELVIALLLGWEQQAARVTDPHYFQPDIDALRRLLQLPTRGPVQ